MKWLAPWLLLAGCSAGTGGTDCFDAGNCPCSVGERCAPAQTCKVDQGWRTLDCACSGGAYACGFNLKDAGPCEPGKYCNKGHPACVNETATCTYDCRCELTTKPTEGVWLCQDNCGAAKDCPRNVDAGCALPASVSCKYWGEGDLQQVCSCSSPDAGSLTCQ